MERSEGMASNENTSFLERRVFGLVGINWEVAAYIAIVGLAFVLRFWDLGSRMLHHDESIHAVYSWYLYSGRGYIHDPMFHGPFLYHINALIYTLLGVSDYAARVAPALFGTAMVAMPYLIRRRLGRNGAIIASFLLAVSPSILYYSRSLRHDMFAATATVLLAVALWRYVEDRRPRWLYLAAGALVLSFTSHELTYITVFIFVTFLLVITLDEWITLARVRKWFALTAEANFLLVLATVILPVFAPVVLIPLGIFPLSANMANVAMWGAFAVLAVAATVIGCWWNRRVWPIAAIIFYGVAILLFTAFFTNPQGVQTGLLGSLQYWLSQHGVQRGGQPLYYYLLLMPLYEFLPLVFSLGGVIYSIMRRNLFGLFLSYWFLASLVIYSWAGEKMPWLLIHIAIPCVLLAGFFLGKVVDKIEWSTVLRRGGAQFFILCCLIVAVIVGLMGLGWPIQSAADVLNTQRDMLQWLAMLVLLTLFVVLLLFYARRLGRRLAWGMCALTLLVVQMPLWTHTSWQVNYYNNDTPVEMLVYVQSSPDVGKVMDEIERIGFRTGQGQDLKIAYDAGVSWPFEWYLRDYDQRAYYGSGNPPADAPVVLVSFENNDDVIAKQQLGDNYVGQRYKLRWWFPEDYKSPAEWINALGGNVSALASSTANLGWGDVLQATLKPDSLAKLWKYFVYRDTLNPLGSTDFMMYVRKDLVSGLWGATATNGAVTAGTVTPIDDDYAAKTLTLAPNAIWGAAGVGPGQFQSPRDVAVGPDGSIYVLDSGNNRVQKLNSQGQYELSWGSSGSAAGQFKEPWGLVVDSHGNVYVADTWNHRVQKFDSNGQFLMTLDRIGTTNDGPTTTVLFYGPRDIAIDAKDNVYVVDTGNHRIAEFDSAGQFVATHGSQGAGEQQFSEPVGIAIDKDGSIYVADSWNRRIQRFDADFNFISRWSIAGWESKSVVNKPYLAVDGQGGVYVSDPEGHRLLKFSTTGVIQAVWGSLGSDRSGFNLPIGLACDQNGAVIIVDSGNNRLVRYAVVQ